MKNSVWVSVMLGLLSFTLSLSLNDLFHTLPFFKISIALIATCTIALLHSLNLNYNLFVKRRRRKGKAYTHRSTMRSYAAQPTHHSHIYLIFRRWRKTTTTTTKKKKRDYLIQDAIKLKFLLMRLSFVKKVIRNKKK